MGAPERGDGCNVGAICGAGRSVNAAGKLAAALKNKCGGAKGKKANSE